jgi:uncharacterized Fe-S center protein
MLLGAYQILYSNIAQHASIYETVNIADGLKVFGKHQVTLDNGYLSLVFQVNVLIIQRQHR